MQYGFRTICVAIYIGCCAFVAPAAFGQVALDFDSLRSMADLLNWCKTSQDEKRQYCEGYINGTVYNWRAATACQSPDYNDQSFCAGVIAARDGQDRYRSICTNCSDSSLSEETETRELDVLDSCLVPNRSGRHYCAGYNSQTDFERITSMSTDSPVDTDDTRALGFAQGAEESALHAFALLWVGQEPFWAPCVGADTRMEDMVGAIDEFIRTYPELQYRDAPADLIAKALFYGLCPGPEGQWLPHLEHCTKWDFKNLNLGTENSCSKPISIHFETGRGEVKTGEVNPGARFDSGLNTKSYFYTVCPPGHVSSLPMTPANREALRNSHYHCVKR